MNKTVLGTILGSVLLGLIGNKADKEKKVQIGSANKEISYQDSYSVLSKFPPHRITDINKFEEIYESMKKNGWKGRPLIYLGNKFLTGSHRYHALLKLFQHDDLEIEVPVIDIEPYLTEYEIDDIQNSIDQEDILNILKSSKVPESIISIYLQDFDPKQGSANKPNRKKKFIVRSVDQGLKVIQHKDITDNWKKSLRVRPKHRVAVLLPCAATKPFAESPSHKYGYLKALGDKDVDLYVVSEPLGIIPYAWQDKYPNADYDYPPKYLKGKARKLLSERIGEWFKKVYPKYDTVYSALPGHHQRLVNDSTDQKLKEVTINQCRQDTCSDSVFRATAGEYVDYLKREIK